MQKDIFRPFLNENSDKLNFLRYNTIGKNNDKYFDFTASFEIIIMVVLGGMGHIGGVILGAILLTLTPEVLREVINPLQRHLFGRMIVDPENLRMLLFGLALIIVMLVKPAGFWPSPRRQEELKHG